MWKRFRNLFTGGQNRASRKAELDDLLKVVTETRPILRRDDLAKIEQTHLELETTVRETREEATRIASTLSVALEQTQRRMSVVLDAIKDGILSVDIHGTILEVNASIESILGFQDEFVVGTDVRDTVLNRWEAPIDFEAEARQYATYLRTWSNKTADGFAKYKLLYQNYVTCFNTKLARTQTTECRTAENRSVKLDVYVNVLNVDCQTAEDIVFVIVLVDVSEKTAISTNLDAADSLQQAILRTVQNPVFYKDERLKFSGSNDAFCAFIGLSKEEFIGKSVFDVFTPSVAAKLSDLDLGLLVEQTPTVHSKEVSLPNVKTNIFTDVVLYYSGLRNQAGTFVGMLGTFVDLNDLADAKNFSELLINLIPMPLYVLDKNYQYTAVNKAYEELVGVPREKLLGKTREAVLKQTVNYAGMYDLDRIYQEKDVELTYSKETTQTYEASLPNAVTKDIAYVMAHRARLQNRKDGSFDGILCILTDITKLQHYQTLHYKIFETTPTPLYYKDKHFRFVVCNSAFAAWFGIPQEEFAGKSLSELVKRLPPSVDIEVFARAASTLHAAEQEVVVDRLCNVNTLQLKLCHPECGIRTVQVYHSALCDQLNRPDGFAGSFVDITERIGES